MFTVSDHPVRPYSDLARSYDEALGNNAHHLFTRLFADLVRRYKMAFHSAADLGCGTGLFARHLRKAYGARVIGVDRSPEMLTVARKNTSGCGVDLFLQDIRRLRLPNLVDMVTALFDTVNHLPGLPDLTRMLARVRDVLVPGGHLVFDSISNLRRFGKGTFVENLPVRGRPLVRAIFPDRDQQGVTHVLVRPLPSGASIREVHRERVFGPRLLQRVLGSLGYRVIGIHDVETLGPATEGSGRVVVVAQKPCQVLGGRFFSPLSQILS